jgi:hypothetical protein
MSYVPSHLGQILMNPSAVCVLLCANNTSSAVGADVMFSSANDFIGTLSSLLSFSGGAFTLPSGYYYWLEGSTQTYSTTLNANTHLEVQWHDGTSGIGTHGRIVQPPYTDQQLSGRDEKALALIDATGGAVSVTLRVTSMTNVIALGLNSTASHSAYAGMGRATIWRLDP